MGHPERAPSPTEMEHGGKESKETNNPSEIRIFAVEQTKTHEDTVTKQGFGYSTPLATSRKRVFYSWQGKLHPTEFESSHPQSREGYTGSSNAGENIVELAQGFAYNYRERQNPDLEKQGSASYTLQFEPSEEGVEKVKEQYGEGAIVRGLTVEEQKAFMNAFQKANEEAAKKRG